MKYCPECVIEDRLHCGEPYWHIAHQFPEVIVCNKHLLHLNEISIENHNFSQSFFILREIIATETMERRTFRITDKESEIRYYVAGSCSILAKQGENQKSIIYFIISTLYNSPLLSLKSYRDLVRYVQARVSISTWLVINNITTISIEDILRLKPKYYYSPFAYALVGYIFGYEQFDEFLHSWKTLLFTNLNVSCVPCPHPHCTNHNCEDNTISLKFSFGFTPNVYAHCEKCHLDFIVKLPRLIHRRQNPISIRSIQIPSYLLSNQTNETQSTRVAMLNAHQTEDTEIDSVVKYNRNRLKELWQAPMERYAKPSDISDEEYELYLWLRKYDTEWMKLNYLSLMLEGFYQAWDAIDVKLAGQLHTVYSTLEQVVPPIRVTKKRLINEARIPKASPLRWKLPKTYEVLIALEETQEAYLFRRINWSLSLYFEAKIIPTVVEVAQRARCVHHLKKYPMLRAKIEDALQVAPEFNKVLPTLTQSQEAN